MSTLSFLFLSSGSLLTTISSGGSLLASSWSWSKMWSKMWSTYHSNQSRRKLGFSWPNSKPRLCEWILASSSHAVATAETLNQNKTKTRKAPHPAHLVSKNVIKPQKAIPCSFFAWQVLAFVLKIIDCSNRSKSIYLCSLVKSATPCQRGPLLFQNLSSGRKPAVPAGELAKPGCMILIATVSFSNACDKIRWHKLANDC